ncbi:DUF2268 domain-containing protein [Rossellomorea aquimaris]|uniref:DUF2268 domain-containing protein n=1 Tax=Rossellomorea aquimaris TaxID=189382 RepID=UPI001CD3B73B|nr:DUF2268 domain-containing putative Zn-dependent protease [Rossellomorea aquimaris]MCA1054260.1 DUF2268 domain-containing protein [Rossellomorea aquimaris]
MKNFWLLFAVILIMGALSACSEDIPEAKEFKVAHNGQTLTVIPLYDHILDYTSEAKGKTKEEKKALYLEKVILPFQEIAEEHGIDTRANYLAFLNGDTDIDQLEKNTIALLKKQDEMETLVKEAFTKSSEELPGKDKSMFLVPVNVEFSSIIKKMEGSTGVTFTEDFMLLQTDPSYKKDAFKNTVAHEYFHSVDMEDQSDGQSTVFDFIVMEGKADSFARIIYPDHISPWTEPLSAAEKEKVFDHLSGNLDSFDLKEYQTLFAGVPSKGIPLWSNYRIGFEIMQDYLSSHPDMTPKEWVLTSSKETLENSPYKEALIPGE